MRTSGVGSLARAPGAGSVDSMHGTVGSRVWQGAARGSAYDDRRPGVARQNTVDETPDRSTTPYFFFHKRKRRAGP